MRGVIRSGPGLTWVIVTLLGLGCATGRVGADEFDQIADKLALTPGMQVADVGAGDGSWSIQIARAVGDQGHVWATEITREDVDQIVGRIEEEKLTNVSPILGGQNVTGLPAGCCDAILLRLVYHHFVDPESMKTSLAESLRPGGILVVIEIRPENSWRELEDVPDRGGHGIDPDALRSELAAVGFDFLERQDDWNGDKLRYCSVFRRRT